MPFFRRVTKKFGHALTGLQVAVTTDNSFKAHLVFTALALGLCLWLQPSPVGWALVVLGVGLVFVAELFNTAIEYLVRMFTSEYHELAEKLLDISAGAVLFASVVALALAALVFLPRLGEVLK
ncbi:MAG TPA: diacylglycerol kinase family protein [Spirochaetia bacterium]|jgi:diacylglycerol kinase|nr:diacylglycerol kinase family protein [Spirochaetia bacterium]